MEAFSTMKLRSLPPVRNPVLLASGDNKTLFSGFDLAWLGSGTEALAYCLLHKKNAAGKNSGDVCDVIVPGYCCPDLLSAIFYAGCRPVIVDIDENDPSYNLGALENALTESTLAVIAVNFLGISERLGLIRELLEGTKIALIEDNAQWFPDVSGDVQFSGDYVTFSFGRGKAVSILGGGLALYKGNDASCIPLKQDQDSFLFPIKATIFNLVTLPWLYHWIEKAPFLNLGKTEYHKMTNILGMSNQRQRLIDGNVRKYQKMTRANEAVLLRSNALNDINLLAPVLMNNRKRRLLRYPLLMDSTEGKARVLSRLRVLGLGGSAMYETELTQVSGVKGLLGADFSTPNASSFAQRFLTLPLHDLVRPRDIERMIDIVCSASSI